MRFSEKNAKNLRFWELLTMLAQIGQFRKVLAQNGPFLSFSVGRLFTLPKTSIHAKYQENPMCGFLEKRLHR